MSIVRDYLRNCIEASEALNTDVGFRNLLKAKTAKLYPLLSGRKGICRNGIKTGKMWNLIAALKV